MLVCVGSGGTRPSRAASHGNESRNAADHTSKVWPRPGMTTRQVAIPADRVERCELLGGGERFRVVRADLEPAAELRIVLGGQQRRRLVRLELLLGAAEQLGHRVGGVGVGLADPRPGQAAEVAERGEHVRVPQREHDRARAALGQPGDGPPGSGGPGAKFCSTAAGTSTVR